MKRSLVAAALFACSYVSVVAVEPSPLAPAYAARFERTVAQLDGYQGNGEALEAARMELDEVLRVYSRHAPAYREKARYFIMRGHIHSMRFRPGSLEAADAALQKALSIDPDSAESFVLYGHLYKLMGRHQDALAALAKAEKLGTLDPWLQNNWADVLAAEGRHEEAALRYRRVVDSGTGNTKAMRAALEGLIAYYLRTGNLGEADAMHRKTIAYAPHVAWSYGNYAQFLLCRKGDVEGAILRGRQAPDIMDYGVGRYWLAAALYRRWAQGDASETHASDYAEARELYPDLPSVARNAGRCPALAAVAEALERGKPAAANHADTVDQAPPAS